MRGDETPPYGPQKHGRHRKEFCAFCASVAKEWRGIIKKRKRNANNGT